MKRYWRSVYALQLFNRRRGAAPVRGHSSVRFIPIILSLVVGLAVTGTSYSLVTKWEEAKVISGLEKQASAHIKALRQSFFILHNNMESIRKLYELEGELTYKMFKTFLNRGLDKHVGVQAIEWIEKVDHSQREAYVDKMRRQGMFDFILQDYGAGFTIADERPVYFPITYTAPQDVNGHLLGVDLRTSSVFNHAMTYASEHKVSFASQAVPILGDEQERYQLRLFLPIFSNQDNVLKGFVTGLIFLDDLVESVLGDPEQSNKFHLSISEENEKGDWLQVYSSDWREPVALDVSARGTHVVWSERVLLAQRVLKLNFSWFKTNIGPSYAPWIVLFFGILTTIGLVGYLWHSLTQMKRVENLVSQRTKSLFSANEALRTEIVERKKVEEELFYNAYRDTLTSCLNRRAFNENLEERFETARLQKDWSFALLFIDLDRLKYVNDTFGHEAGDDVIVATARRIMSQIRLEDKLARLGGDEFAIILEGIEELPDAQEISNRILEILREPFKINQEDFVTSGSIGIALAHEGYQRPEDLVRDSDIAMYHAKKSGRNRYAVFTREMHERAIRDMTLQKDLNEALTHKQFFMVYQPVFKAATDRLYGYEALVRWEHPSLGLVPPTDFIPLCEELGLIHDLGEWIIQKALEDLQRIQQLPGCKNLRMNINVSPLQVLRPRLIESLKAALTQYGIDPITCQIELTESALGTSAEEMALYLSDLKKLGVRVLVDDFGTEHASLNHLNLFPIDGLKIDRSFVTDIEKDITKRKLIKTIIGLKDILDLSITAEGIENERQKNLLTDMDCTFLQGYLCGRPDKIDAVLAYLFRENSSLRGREPLFPEEYKRRYGA